MSTRNAAFLGKDLLGIEELQPEQILAILDTAEPFKEISERQIKKVPLLRGKTIVNAFFENSTRTRISFEFAEKRLSADTVNFAAGGSSVSKGETLVDTARNLEAMRIDMVVIRHGSSGAARFLGERIASNVINAGDGKHEHPTQALLDLLTIRDHLGRIEEAIEWADVLNVLRLQLERMQGGFVPSLREYNRVFGVTQQRVDRAPRDLLILHPGPMNRGVEIDSVVADGPHSVILEQVTNGVAIRMAVLYLLAGGEPEAAEAAKGGGGL